MRRGTGYEPSAYQRTFPHPQVYPFGSGQAAGRRSVMFAYPLTLKGEEAHNCAAGPGVGPVLPMHYRR